MTESQPTGHPEIAVPGAGPFLRIMFTAEQIARRVRELGLGASSGVSRSSRTMAGGASTKESVEQIIHA